VCRRVREVYTRKAVGVSIILQICDYLAWLAKYIVTFIFALGIVYFWVGLLAIGEHKGRYRARGTRNGVVFQSLACVAATGGPGGEREEEDGAGGGFGGFEGAEVGGGAVEGEADVEAGVDEVAACGEVHEGDVGEGAVGVAGEGELGGVEALEIGGVDGDGEGEGVVGDHGAGFVEIGDEGALEGEVVVEDFAGAGDAGVGGGGVDGFEHVEVGGFVVEGGVVEPVGGLAGLVVGVEAAGAVVGGDAEFDGVDGGWIGEGAAGVAEAADLEAVFVAVEASVVVGPAVVEGDAAAGVVDAVVAVVGVGPGAVAAEDVAGAGGMAAEAVGVSGGDAVDADEVVGIAVEDEVVGGVGEEVEAIALIVVGGDLVEGVAAAGDAPVVGLFEGAGLDAGDVEAFEGIVGAGDFDGADAEGGGGEGGEVEDGAGVSGVGEVGDVALGEVEAVLVGGVGGGDGGVGVSAAAEVDGVAGGGGLLGAGEGGEGLGEGACGGVAAGGGDVVGGGVEGKCREQCGHCCAQ
jgi:hypothetical protein